LTAAKTVLLTICLAETKTNCSQLGNPTITKTTYTVLNLKK